MDKLTRQPVWLEAMLDPMTYPHPVDEVRLVQTHISWVFLAGDRVYKIKKPVDFGFLDFTSLEKRHHFCLEELRLNRRLAPQIYLGVWPITSENGVIHLNGKGQILEWAVVMARMPESGMMTRLIEDDLFGEDEIDEIARRLAPFYLQAKGDNKIRRFGGIETIIQNTEENFEQTLPFVGDIIDKDAYEQIVQYTRLFIDKGRDVFKGRVDDGWIIEGHGDLYSANICFDKAKNEIYIFDCIEFNERFRCGDMASDVAFLAMDLDYHGLPHLANRFARVFSEKTGDKGLFTVLDFYKCYRAYVRGKIGCFTWASQEVNDEVREAARRQALHYFRLALRYAGGGAIPTLYVFFGPSGSGKSTVSNAWAMAHGLPVYNSDRVRKELVLKIPASERHIEPLESGIYDPKITERTYRALARLGAAHLMQGESVVLDATYKDAGERGRILKIAKESGADVRFILCACSEDEIRRRLSERAGEEGQVSDGRWEIYLAQKEFFAPDAIKDIDIYSLETSSMPIDDLIARLSAAFIR
ncbi:MAG: bifunctional aminoglycoside phosphotransferase/ATP-binding protein [Dissulfurimicrobium sp.]|uniref:bifunctional aminoglycoside phosphotransferase/ATP-binding protein n=1 Tax=Dissulfurimicrobium sp. TaxID=2022436 RepID=UPI004048EC51